MAPAPTPNAQAPSGADVMKLARQPWREASRNCALKKHKIVSQCFMSMNRLFDKKNQKWWTKSSIEAYKTLKKLKCVCPAPSASGQAAADAAKDMKAAAMAAA